MRVTAVLLACTITSACLPVMPHPTRVDAAFRVGVASGIAMVVDSNTTREDVRAVGVPFADLDVALGIRDTTSVDKPGVRLAGSAGMTGIGGSAYLELPRRMFGILDAGAGIAYHRGSFNTLLPYAQFGGPISRDADWFVRNAVAFVRNPTDHESATLWMPSAGMFRRNGSRMSSVYLAAVIGGQPRIRRYCVIYRCIPYSNRDVHTFLIVGGSVSFAIATPRYGEPPPSRR